MLPERSSTTSGRPGSRRANVVIVGAGPAGLAHRLESINSFVACADESGHGHGPMAFVICNICGKVDEFVDSRIGARIANWTKENGFKVEQTTIEIRGRCAACLEAA